MNQKNENKSTAQTTDPVMDTDSFLQLRPGKKYTIVKFGEMGIPYSMQFTLSEARIQPYAQYPEAVMLIFKKKGARNIVGFPILPVDDYLIYSGWIDVNTGLQREPTEYGHTVTIEFYNPEYLENAKRSVSQAPVLENITKKSEK
jgi:hypothetical protein